MIRSKRRLSTRRRSGSTSGETSTAKPTGWGVPASPVGAGGAHAPRTRSPPRAEAPPPPGAPAGPPRPPHQLSRADVVERELGGAGIEPGDFQKVVHHASEPGQVGVEEGQGPLSLRGQLVPVGLEHSDRSRKRGERGPKFVTDVGREPCLPLDPSLEIPDRKSG